MKPNPKGEIMSSDKAVKPQHIYNDLYDLLVEYFPDHRSKHGVFDVPTLAADLGKSHETIYKALLGDKLHLGVAHAILRLSHKRHPEMPLYWGDVIRFVLPEYRKLSDPSIFTEV
ncbi:hypothetical protein P1J78_23390 [Psychromarinibacter sp. C21-152]|uniref:Uncharacterized protein n=1 Tax=Psychromarinibacter sediminicola TaxID=3033385 RepID=A0AAE3NXX3_9RHOB|nr:hypothetical protein [Psychromarinibacter sediminicola]MDF0603674.1 hypothetical protein [Psychromarinibacter sediminicola]